MHAARPCAGSDCCRLIDCGAEVSPKAAIAILEPMLRNGYANLHRKRTWRRLGSSRLVLPGRWRCLIRRGRHTGSPWRCCDRFPLRRRNMRRRIDNLATLEEAQGQTDAAKALAQKASRIYDVTWRPCRDRHCIHQSGRDCLRPERLQDGATQSRDRLQGSGRHDPIERGRCCSHVHRNERIGIP